MDEYKQMIVESGSDDVVYTNLFSGVRGNYLRGSVVRTGYDPDNLPDADKSKMNFGSGSDLKAKVWRDIWSAGQGVGNIHEVLRPAVDRAHGGEERGASARRWRLRTCCHRKQRMAECST
jgi:nitronate monooxygenase